MSLASGGDAMDVSHPNRSYSDFEWGASLHYIECLPSGGNSFDMSYQYLKRATLLGSSLRYILCLPSGGDALDMEYSCT